jgi:hypothetical protein
VEAFQGTHDLRSDYSFGGRTAKVHAGATEMFLFCQDDSLTALARSCGMPACPASIINTSKRLFPVIRVLADSALLVIVLPRLPEVIWRSRCNLSLLQALGLSFRSQ